MFVVVEVASGPVWSRRLHTLDRTWRACAAELHTATQIELCAAPQRLLFERALLVAWERSQFQYDGAIHDGERARIGPTRHLFQYR